MGPLISPHDCDSCLHKSLKIAELERRISNLYWIRGEKALLDSVVSIGTGPAGNPVDLDSTAPVSDAGSSVSTDTHPTGLSPAERTVRATQLHTDDDTTTANVTSRPASSVPAPHLPAEDPWLLLRAMPKWATRRAEATFTCSPNPRFRANSSTPSQEPW
ncbi:hypothetical protein ABVT39_018943 [Epinephelus coioides]